MAIVKGALQVTGSIKGVSFYSRVGSDKVIMRTKGGPTKQRIAKGQEFEKLRTHQQEWGGCVKFARAVRYAVGEMYRLGDFNLSPVWTGIGKNLMKLDQIGKVGERRLFLTNYRQALESFNMNRNYPLNSVLRVLPTINMVRENLNVRVTFPRINTGTDIMNIQRLPYFRLLICMGCVSDLQYNPQNLFDNYEPMVEVLHGVSSNAISDWFSADNVLNEQTLIVQLNEELKEFMTENVSLLVSIGIEFGKVGFGGEIVEVKHAGCGKIVMVG
jgi:hypothetical protein